MRSHSFEIAAGTGFSGVSTLRAPCWTGTFSKDTVTSGYRIGIGHDTHRLIAGGPLLLGGVVMEHSARLLGHSDADVLLHAVTDALLGAIAAGDIGELFPDTAPENRGRDSAEMLRLAYQQVCQAGYDVVNLDCTVFAQRPRLSPYKQQIRECIAGILAIPVSAVNVKAKTGEQVGPVGREEAIAAQCVVLLNHRPGPPPPATDHDQLG